MNGQNGERHKLSTNVFQNGARATARPGSLQLGYDEFAVLEEDLRGLAAAFFGDLVGAQVASGDRDQVGVEAAAEDARLLVAVGASERAPNEPVIDASADKAGAEAGAAA